MKPTLFLISLAALATSASAQPTPPVAPVAVGIASFNMAWAGTAEDFQRYLAVCGAPAVNWCDTRARTLRGATAPAPEEAARAQKCQADTLAAAGGPEASMMVAPCNAYRHAQAPVPGMPPPDPAPLRKPEAYAGKMAALTATVERLVDQDGVSVIAFQEVKSRAVIETVLGRHAAAFEVCVAKHNAFQTLAFAWRKALTQKPGVCTTHEPLAILDPPNDPAAFRRVRPGLALELTVGGAPAAFLNVHLKSGCANIVATERFPSRLLTDANEACQVLNRQVPLLEGWIDALAARSPRLVWLGDFNRRIDEEAAAAVAKGEVRTDGGDPTGPHQVDALGKVPTRYLWPEIADGSPVLHQVPLAGKDPACTGFVGLDHIVISDALAKANPGVTSRKVAVASVPGQVMEASDHCPRVVSLKF